MQYLKLIKTTGKNKWGKSKGLYHCNRCGNDIETLITYVNNNRKTNCGCLNKENAKNRLIKHGMTHSPEYNAWLGMKARCYKKTYQHYNRYGGRGIKVCDEWKNNFMQFYKDMGEKPAPNYQLDRIDNDGNYCKENCRWVTPSQNCYNRTRYHNKTGFTGVSKNTSSGKYSAWYSLNRKHIQVGTFETPEEAYKERIKAIKKYNKTHKKQLEFVEYDDYIKDIV